MICAHQPGSEPIDILSGSLRERANESYFVHGSIPCRSGAVEVGAL